MSENTTVETKEEKKTLWEQLMDGAATVFAPVKRRNRLNKDKMKFKTALGNLMEKEVELEEQRQTALANIAEEDLNPQTLIDNKRELRKNKQAQEDVKEIYKELFGKELKVDVD